MVSNRWRNGVIATPFCPCLSRFTSVLEPPDTHLRVRSAKRLSSTIDSSAESPQINRCSTEHALHWKSEGEPVLRVKREKCGVYPGQAGRYSRVHGSGK